jgi:hypothetical protein
MSKNRRLTVLSAMAFLGLGLAGGFAIDVIDEAGAQSSERVFELRTYTTHPGRLEALHARFADHTIRIFEKHGMTNVGYFTPQDSPLSENTLVYILAHDSRDAAKASWSAFVSDPEWQQVFEASKRDGDIVEKLESVFLDATSYSQLK